METIEIAKIFYYAAIFVGIAGAVGQTITGIAMLGLLLKRKNQDKYKQAVIALGAIALCWMVLSGIFGIVALAVYLMGNI